MKNRIPVLLAFLLSGTSLCAGAVPPPNYPPVSGTAAPACVAADRSGCSILIRRGVNEAGYYLTIDTGEHGAGSVQVGFKGRSIVISRSDFRRTQRSSDRGAFASVSRSSRFASRLRLPPDADPSRVRRVEQDGVITIILPRLQPPRPGQFGYYPYP